MERAYWDAAVKGLASPVTSPAAVSFETLPFHWRLYDRLARCRFGPNRIAGGDFEDIDTMMRAGWRYVQHGTSSIQTAADLAPDAAHSGRLGLRLAAAAVDPKNPPAVVETPPVLFTSPPVQVEAGQIVCVYGWVRVPAPITGSADGLMIVDSLSGEALADRIGQNRRLAAIRALSRGAAVGGDVRDVRTFRPGRSPTGRRGHPSGRKPAGHVATMKGLGGRGQGAELVKRSTRRRMCYKA